MSTRSALFGQDLKVQTGAGNRVAAPPAALVQQPAAPRYDPGVQVIELQTQLLTTQRNLAELIDEVVFAENEKLKAEKQSVILEKERNRLDQLLQNMMGYVIAIENSVLIPACDRLTEVIPSGTVESRAKMLEELASVSDVSPRTMRLISALKKPSKTNRERFKMRRDQLLRHAEAHPLALDDAYALCALLLDAKDELQLLIADSRMRLTDSTSSSPTDAVPSTTKMTIDKLQHEADALRKEKELLNRRVQELTAAAEIIGKNGKPVPESYAMLQVQQHAEKERLQKQVRELEGAVQRATEASRGDRDRIFDLEDTVKELQELRRLKDTEDAQMRRGTSARGLNSNFGSKNSLLQQPPNAAEEMHRLRLELDATVRNHSNVVTKYEAQIATLRLELTEARQHAKPMAGEHFSQIQRTNDLLRKDLVILQQKLLSSSSHVTDGSPNFDGKVRAFESTIAALNRDLEVLEQKIMSSEGAFEDEREALVSTMDKERAKYQEEKEEYDGLMQKMVEEMDAMVVENKQLKDRIVKLQEMTGR